MLPAVMRMKIHIVTEDRKNKIKESFLNWKSLTGAMYGKMRLHRVAFVK